MLRRKLAESLTIRIFLITVLLLLGAGTVTFGLIAWATPSTYTAVVNDDLTRQTDRLVGKLADTDLADSGPLLDDFIRDTGADAVLAGRMEASWIRVPCLQGRLCMEQKRQRLHQ